MFTLTFHFGSGRRPKTHTSDSLSTPAKKSHRDSTFTLTIHKKLRSCLVMNTTCKCVTTPELKIHRVLLSGHRSGRVSPNKKTERLIMLKLITFSWEEAAQ